MDKVKIGVIGGGRGKSMIRYGREASNAELVAICDFRDDVLGTDRASHNPEVVGSNPASATTRKASSS